MSKARLCTRMRRLRKKCDLFCVLAYLSVSIHDASKTVPCLFISLEEVNKRGSNYPIRKVIEYRITRPDTRPYVAPRRPKCESVTDGRTDGRTNGRTDTPSYRVASSRLKTKSFSANLSFFPSFSLNLLAEVAPGSFCGTKTIEATRRHT